MSLLWTDVFFLCLVAFSIFWLCLSCRVTKNRKILAELFHNPRAISSGVILFFFFAIAILDCIHFKPNTNTDKVDSNLVSMLDEIMTKVRSTDETSYSAPLSLHALNAEMQVQGAVVKQFFPRLNYPSPTIKNKQDKYQTIKADINVGIIRTLIIIAILGLILAVIQLVFKFKHIHYKSWLLSFSIFSLGVLTLTILWQLAQDFHVFGTGKIGQDVFYMTLKSIRTGLIIGTLTTFFMLPFALVFGIAAGYFGGIIDDIIQYIYTTLSSIPGILLITASVLAMQTYITNHPEDFVTLDKNADARLLTLCFILGITSWTSLCRLLRAEALKLRALDFVLAARVVGTSSARILFKHILPNVLPIILITLVLDFSFLVLAEAVLSYVGVGVSPMTFSWGNMINSARLELAREPLVWWPMLAAFLPMFILVLASNLFADAVRDVLDPHHSA